MELDLNQSSAPLISLCSHFAPGNTVPLIKALSWFWADESLHRLQWGLGRLCYLTQCPRAGFILTPRAAVGPDAKVGADYPRDPCRFQLWLLGYGGEKTCRDPGGAPTAPALVLTLEEEWTPKVSPGAPWVHQGFCVENSAELVVVSLLFLMQDFPIF